MRKIISLLLIMISSMALFSSDLTFSGGRSSLNLMEGKEEVVLSEGAEVSIDSIRIESDKITLRGSGWNEVLCQGKTTIVDSEHNLEIRASSIWFDRTSERILISSWFEIDDSENEISATGNSMEFDMKNKVLKLDKDGKPVFGDKCVSCYACYHRCPEKALRYKNIKGQYKGLVETKELFRR